MPHYRRMLLSIIICILLIETQTRDTTLSVLSDVFWQVAVFVTASFMGVLPGCGGAIVVITQYVSGQMSFGAVTAVLTSTMEDAAFLLLVAEPITGAFLLMLSFVVGVITESIVNRIHGPDFFVIPCAT
jgi:hypothetical protein